MPSPLVKMLLALVAILSIFLQVNADAAPKPPPTPAEQNFDIVRKCINKLRSAANVRSLQYDAILNAYANLKASSTSQADLDKYVETNKLNLKELTITPVLVKKKPVVTATPGTTPVPQTTPVRAADSAPAAIPATAPATTPATPATAPATAPATTPAAAAAAVAAVTATFVPTVENCPAKLDLPKDILEKLTTGVLNSFGYAYNDAGDYLVLDPKVIETTIDGDELVDKINKALDSKMKWNKELLEMLEKSAALGNTRIDDKIREKYNPTYAINTDFDYITFRNVKNELDISKSLKKTFEALDSSYHTADVAGVFISQDTFVLCMVIPE